MRYKGKRFYPKDKPNKNQNIPDAEDVFVDVEDDSDTFDVELDNSDFTDVNEDAVSEAQPNQGDNLTPQLTLREKRKMVKNEKKMRDKNTKVDSKAGVSSKTIAFDESVKKHQALKDKSPKATNNTHSNNNSQKKKLINLDGSDHDKSNTSYQKISKTIKLNKKNIVLAVIIVFVLVLSVLAFSNRDRLTFSNFKNWVEYGILNRDKEEHFPISTDGSLISNGNFTRIDNNLVYVSDTKFATTNNYGRTIYSYKQGFSSPILARAADSDLSLVYNLGGNEFAINNLDSTIYTGEVEDNILVADISKSGVYGIVTAKYGYLSKLYVYSKNNKQIYAYSFADFYITSVSLDSKGNSAVLTGVSAHDATKLSAVYLLDFNKEEPVVFEEINDNIIYHAQHLNNKYVCLIGENASYTLNTFTKELSTVNYDGKTLTAFDVNTDTNNFVLSLSRSGDGRMCDILTFSSSGKWKNTITTELAISAMSTYKNRVAVLCNGMVYLYTKDGNMLLEKEAGLDPHSIVLYSVNDAYILGVSEIRRLDLR